jgi:hypothetical protein
MHQHRGQQPPKTVEAYDYQLVRLQNETVVPYKMTRTVNEPLDRDALGD